MTFRSILFPNTTDHALGQDVSEPDYFSDLVLDQVVAAITASKAEYDLSGFFHAPLRNVDDISFRQEVMQDLEQPQLLDHIKAFSNSMKTMRQHLDLAEKLHYRYQKEYWVLDAATIYGAAVPRLADALSEVKVASRGLLAFKDYVSRYIASQSFTSLVERTEKLTTDLQQIHYNLLIKGTQVEVRHHEREPDYSVEVDATFQKFKQGAVKDYLFDASDSAGMNHVEAAILGLVAKLYPAIFSDLENYVADYRDFADAVIVQFDREIQFYIAYLEFIGRFRNVGLEFCYPRVTRACKEVYDYRGFDIALADRLVGQNSVPVCNDFHLKGRERLVVVSGPNQGGKTTFARTFGQLHCPPSAPMAQN
jgi:DNA mismatch repair protein MutS